MSNRPDKITEVVSRFDALPNDAIVQTKVTALLTGLSERTVRYHPKLKRHYVSADRYGQRAGDVRTLMRDGWQSLGDVAERVVEGTDPNK